MKYIVNYKWRLLTLAVMLAALLAGALMFSSVLAGPKRTAPASQQPTRTARTIASNTFTFSAPQVLVRPLLTPIPGGVVSLKDQDLEPEIRG